MCTVSAISVSTYGHSHNDHVFTISYKDIDIEHNKIFIFVSIKVSKYPNFVPALKQPGNVPWDDMNSCLIVTV